MTHDIDTARSSTSPLNDDQLAALSGTPLMVGRCLPFSSTDSAGPTSCGDPAGGSVPLVARFAQGVEPWSWRSRSSWWPRPPA